MSTGATITRTETGSQHRLRRWVLDVPTLTWTRVPDLPVEDHVQGQSAAFAGTAGGGLVFLWGGSRWPGWQPQDPGPTGDGELVADGWVWSLPVPE